MLFAHILIALHRIFESILLVDSNQVNYLKKNDADTFNARANDVCATMTL